MTASSLQNIFSTQAHYCHFNSQRMYAGCPKAGHICTRAGPLQAAYTSVTPQKMKKQQSSTGREYWYGRPTSLEDTKAYRNSKIVNKLIQSTQKEISPKTLEASPVWSPILL
jgi:hypothetical protein